MSDLNTVKIPELSGDEVVVERANGVWESDRNAVAFVSAEGWLDREGTVRAIEALTALIEAHDTREAAAASKLKRGDVVRLKTNPTWIYTITADEDTDGRVDLVCLARWGEPAGDFVNDHGEGFERIPA